LLDPAAKTRALFRPEAVESLLAEHQQHRFNHSARLWALLVLELWMQEWMPSRSAIAQASASV
jgi:asparagine synthase (glutamine-hydrolysing)